VQAGLLSRDIWHSGAQVVLNTKGNTGGDAIRKTPQVGRSKTLDPVNALLELAGQVLHPGVDGLL
jgi:hypothetical protein